MINAIEVLSDLHRHMYHAYAQSLQTIFWSLTFSRRIDIIILILYIENPERKKMTKYHPPF